MCQTYLSVKTNPPLKGIYLGSALHNNGLICRGKFIPFLSYVIGQGKQIGNSRQVISEKGNQSSLQLCITLLPPPPPPPPPLKYRQGRCAISANLQCAGTNSIQPMMPRQFNEAQTYQRGAVKENSNTKRKWINIKKSSLQTYKEVVPIPYGQ